MTSCGSRSLQKIIFVRPYSVPLGEDYELRWFTPAARRSVVLRRQRAGDPPRERCVDAQGRPAGLISEWQESNLLDQSLASQEVVRNVLDVATLAIECVIQFLHLLVGNLVA